MSSLVNDPQVKEEIARIKSQKDLPNRADLEVPILDMASSRTAIIENVRRIQAYIESFEYNYTGKPFIRMNKSKGALHVFNVSKQLIKEQLPIQCVEAVFLGTHLTAPMARLDRVPLSFKTKFVHGTVHRHIVLAIRYEGKWGALGISRRDKLMNRPISFTSLADLVLNYRESYEECYHQLLTVYIGLPMPHNQYIDQPLKWRATKVRVFNNTTEDVVTRINKFATNMTKINEYFVREGSLPDTTSRKAPVLVA
jgi:tubulinyl-Tyr carboxypeptidase